MQLRRLVLPLLASTAPSALVRGDQPHGIDYLGAGYDLVFGNPDGAEDSSSVADPGFRDHIVQFAWDEASNSCSGLANNWTCPREATVLPQTSCQQQSSSQLISSTETFQRELQWDCVVSATASGSFGGFSASAAFTGSRAMAAMADATSSQRLDIFQSKAVCVDYVAALKQGVTSNTLDVVPEFATAVKSLPSTYTACYLPGAPGGACPQRFNVAFGGSVPPVRGGTQRLAFDTSNPNTCACDDSVAKFFRFIQIYGTHYTTRIEMGGKIVHRVEIKQSDTATLRATKVDVAYGASIKASYDSIFTSASVGLTKDSSSSNAFKSYKAVMNVAQKEININIGGSPSENWREWAKTTTSTPMPIRYRLSSLVELVMRVDASKGPLFERAVADYSAAYGKMLTRAATSGATVQSIQLRFTLAEGGSEKSFELYIGKPGDMPSAGGFFNGADTVFKLAVPPQYRVSFDAFVGIVPVGIRYTDYYMSTPVAKFNWFQVYAVMSDGTVLPLDDTYYDKELPRVRSATGALWSINPME